MTNYQPFKITFLCMFFLFLANCSGSSIGISDFLGVENSQITDENEESAYYIDENGDELSVDSEVVTDSNVTGSSGWGGQATEDSSETEEGASGLADIDVVNLPVTIAKEDQGDGGNDNTCDYESRQRTFMAYTEGEETYFMQRVDAGSLGVGRLGRLAKKILTAEYGFLEGLDLGDHTVFFLSSENVSDVGEVMPVTCEEVSGGEDATYSWRAMSPYQLIGYEIQTGFVRVTSGGKIILGDEVMVSTFGKDSTPAALRVFDFSLNSRNNDIPYLILRASSF